MRLQILADKLARMRWIVCACFGASPSSKTSSGTLSLLVAAAVPGLGSIPGAGMVPQGVVSTQTNALSARKVPLDRVSLKVCSSGQAKSSKQDSSKQDSSKKDSRVFRRLRSSWGPSEIIYETLRLGKSNNDGMLPFEKQPSGRKSPISSLDGDSRNPQGVVRPCRVFR